jgi:hypothetical protein
MQNAECITKPPPWELVIEFWKLDIFSSNNRFPAPCLWLDCHQQGTGNKRQNPPDIGIT